MTEQTNYPPVGLQLDKAIALEVIGMRPDQLRIIEAQDRAYYKNAILGWIDLPRFSENIADAWDIVELFKKEGLSIHIYPYTYLSDGYRVAVYNQADEITYDTGLTAPEAICRAVLRLFREHQEENDKKANSVLADPADIPFMAGAKNGHKRG